jgi:hypothetical protein
MRQVIRGMFAQLSSKMNANLVSTCCAGEVCKGSDSNSEVFYQFMPAHRSDSQVIVWLRLGRDEEYVKNKDPPSCDEAHFNVVERLRQ